MSVVKIGEMSCAELVQAMKQPKKDFCLEWTIFNRFPFPIDQRLAKENIGLDSCEAFSLLNVMLRMTRRFQARRELGCRAASRNINVDKYIESFRSSDDRKFQVEQEPLCRIDDFFKDREWPREVKEHVQKDEATVWNIIDKIVGHARERNKRLAFEMYLESMQFWAGRLDDLEEEIRSRVLLLESRFARKRGCRGGQGKRNKEIEGISKSKKKSLRMKRAKMKKASSE